jgi:hypothetical protein
MSPGGECLRSPVLRDPGGGGVGGGGEGAVAVRAAVQKRKTQKRKQFLNLPIFIGATSTLPPYIRW